MKQRKWTDLQLIEAVKSCNTFADILKMLGLTRSGSSYSTIKQQILKLNISIEHITNRDSSISPESRKRISEARKQFLSTHKNEHNWSRFRREESKPELLFQEALVLLGVSATRFYIPPENDRLFELDFALPDKKIAFEINGNQHYNPDGYLATYYNDRHQYFEKKKWILHEIHYSECFDAEKLKEIITNALTNIDVQYSSTPQIVNYRKIIKEAKQRKKQEDKLKRSLELATKRFEAQLEKERSQLTPEELLAVKRAAAKIMLEKRPSTKGMPQPNRRKVARPTKDELLQLLWDKPTTHIAKQFGVSDKAIEKWAKTYGIKKPPRGYWQKKANQ